MSYKCHCQDHQGYRWQYLRSTTWMVSMQGMMKKRPREGIKDNFRNPSCRNRLLRWSLPQSLTDRILPDKKIFWWYLGDIFGISWGYLGDILGISWGYLGNILGISWGYLLSERTSGVTPVIFSACGTTNWLPFCLFLLPGPNRPCMEIAKILLNHTYYLKLSRIII